jgi:hypothetical protein
MAQIRPDCQGLVPSLRDQRVLCTGTTLVDGERTHRKVLHAAIREHGAQVVSGTRNSSITLLVVGDLPAGVTDPVNHRSQNLVYVEEQREQGNHVCIVDDNGISVLLRGDEARCLRSRAVGSGEIELSLPALPSPSAPRLVPLTVGTTATHDPTGLELDLSGLDAGTAAHQQTLALLVGALLPTVVQALSTPKADAAWSSRADASVLAVAEVKSLTGADQSQQIRLGIGQVLDYAVSLRARPPEGTETVRPVLVLEKEPDDPERWKAVAIAAGITLTWPPFFAELPC